MAFNRSPVSVHLDVRSNLEIQVEDGISTTEGRAIGKRRDCSVVQRNTAKVQQVIGQNFNRIWSVCQGCKSLEEYEIVNELTDRGLLVPATGVHVILGVEFGVHVSSPHTPQLETRTICIFCLKSQSQAIKLRLVKFACRYGGQTD